MTRIFEKEINFQVNYGYSELTITECTNYITYRLYESYNKDTDTYVYTPALEYRGIDDRRTRWEYKDGCYYIEQLPTIGTILTFNPDTISDNDLPRFFKPIDGDDGIVYYEIDDKKVDRSQEDAIFKHDVRQSYELYYKYFDDEHEYVNEDEFQRRRDEIIYKDNGFRLVDVTMPDVTIVF